MFPSYILAAFLELPALTSAFHNVTYASNDISIVYKPTGAWSYWTIGPCPQWQAGGQWTTDDTGSISLIFVGVAVYAYGLWDDNTNPIYTITVDNDTPVVLGNQTNTNPQSCDPLYSKTGLSLKNHEITLQMTSIRPDDMRDLSFQGFIVTVPDVGDGFATDTGGASPTSSGGLGGLIPTSLLGGLLPTHTSGASRRSHIPLKAGWLGGVVTLIIALGLI